MDIPVMENRHYDWVIKAHLENFVSSLYDSPQEKTIFSFRDYMKRKMKPAEFNELFGIQSYKHNA